MMNPRTLVALAVTALILVLIAGISMQRFSDRMQSANGSAETPTLLPNIAESLDSIDRLTLERARDTVTLVRADGSRWRVQEEGGYWASEEKLRELLLGLSIFEVKEPRTSSPELHERLGLADFAPGEESDSPATRLVIASGDNELARLMVGRVASGYQSTQEIYVRRDGDAQTWLVRSPLRVEGSPSMWIERSIVNIAPERLRRMSVERWDLDDLHMERPSPHPTAFELLTIPAGAESKGASELLTLGRGLQNVTLSSVKPAAGFFDELTSETLVTAAAWDGLVLATTIRRDTADKYWATVEASVDESLREAEDAPADMKSIEDVRSEAEEINTRVAGWAYELPAWKGTALTKPNSEYLVSPDEEAAAAEVTPLPDISEQLRTGAPLVTEE